MCVRVCIYVRNFYLYMYKCMYVLYIINKDQGNKDLIYIFYLPSSINNTYNTSEIFTHTDIFTTFYPKVLCLIPSCIPNKVHILCSS